MRLILAIISPEKLAAVQSALNPWDVSLMTVSEVFDCRKRYGTREIYRGTEVRRPVSRMRLEVAVDDSCFDVAMEAIRRAGCSEQLDEGNVFVMGLEERARPCACERDPVLMGL
jgi:nitrogen regulatory protein P-II 1